MANILYFTAVWCGPCRMFKPLVDQVANETGAHVQYVDVDNNPEMTQKFGVSSVPTIIVEQAGATLFRTTGAMPKAQLVDVFNRFK